MKDAAGRSARGRAAQVDADVTGVHPVPALLLLDEAGEVHRVLNAELLHVGLGLETLRVLAPGEHEADVVALAPRLGEGWAMTEKCFV